MVTWRSHASMIGHEFRDLIEFSERCNVSTSQCSPFFFLDGIRISCEPEEIRHSSRSWQRNYSSNSSNFEEIGLMFACTARWLPTFCHVMIRPHHYHGAATSDEKPHRKRRCVAWQHGAYMERRLHRPYNGVPPGTLRGQLGDGHWPTLQPHTGHELAWIQPPASKSDAGGDGLVSHVTGLLWEGGHVFWLPIQGHTPPSPSCYINCKH